MEAYLIENPAVLALDPDEDEEIEIIEDQLSFNTARKPQSEGGRIDLLAHYKFFKRLGIIELKKGTIKEKNIEQLEGYLKERKSGS